MLPGMNPRDLQKAMKKMGMKQEEIDANEVIIKCGDKDLVVKNPQVTKIKMMGQETIQVVGDITEVEQEAFNKEDIKTVMDQTGCDEEEAKSLLEQEGDIAAAILAFEKK